MALEKKKILSNLQEVSYWRIVRINHLAKGETEIVLGGFASKEVSDKIGDTGVLAVENFNFDIPKEDIISKNSYEVAYKKIKESKLDENNEETNFFVDAKDC